MPFETAALVLSQPTILSVTIEILGSKDWKLTRNCNR
jgi:hypothetical protein